ncbi:MAG: ATP-binding cassette domain-containing protein [Oscillospiraceae bacterium]|jgi:ABC-type nitrate/sulfonate/bicarbonate transport system ATPase subunit|nr:ABC transporter ATP-binding protein [Ruminococcaceae bacterium BL-4]
MKLSVNHLNVSFGEKVVIRDFSMDFSLGKITCLTGPSGCGKTTLLRVLCGLQSTETGVVNNPFSVSFAFQEDRLFPWLSAQDNIAAVLPGKRKNTKTEAKSWLKRVGLEGEEEKLPASLSGGMCQRVSLARALAADRELLLLDEPFHAMDAVIKKQCMDLIRSSSKGKTIIFVTHDLEEADQFADEICFFSGVPLTLEKKVIKKRTYS